MADLDGRTSSSLGPEPKSPSQALKPENVAAPQNRHAKRARSPVVVLMNGLFSLALLGVLLAGIAIYIGMVQFNAPGPLATDRNVDVTRGMTTRQIANMLESRGIIGNRLLFMAGVYARQARSSLQAGEYAIEAGASMADVLDKLIEGDAVVYSVTFPEGWTSQQIVNRLLATEDLTGEITDVPPEGALLPSTYAYSPGATRQSVLDRMVQAQDAALGTIWERRIDELPITSPEELVILASIVEKETARADERTRVAAVFINRLNRGMPLQSDPTILYGVFGGDAWLEPRPIYRSQLRDQSNPYNTYVIPALPPGPIANPGRASLEAVANPSRTDDLFFVADGTGGHAFAETYEEHNRNVARWREIEREREAERERRAAEEAAQEAAGADGETGSTSQ
ncbi:MAG: endolytic transglycosylase MltG [Devosiaceae bacterium]|nr:endolytic transglycosylase MltG [Devosiaceae bacterium MH13]